MNMFAFVIREKIVKVANHNNYVFLKIIMEPRINLFSFMKTKLISLVLRTWGAMLSGSEFPNDDVTEKENTHSKSISGKE